MNYFFCGGALAVMLALAPGAAPYAQESDDEVIEEIITIGTPGGAGIQKRDVSFAVTVLVGRDREICSE